LAFVVACTDSSTTGGAGFGGDNINVGGNPSGGQATAGSGGGPVGSTTIGGSVVNGGSGGVIVTGGIADIGSGGVSATGGITAGGTGPTAGSGDPTVCDAPIPNCAGLSGCELTICVLARGSGDDKIPVDCSCLSGERLAQCCAQVREGMEKYSCLDLTNYPECETKLECPMHILDSLKANPYPGAEQISQECVDCLCSNCITQLDLVASSEPTAVTLLQCAIANHVIKDCVVCNPAPCDTRLGTNMMTGPCSQELLAACPDCSCSGALDLNCLSLAGCMTESTVSTLPCRTAHMTLQCLAANCPACPALPDCPSNF
jgi:hypothetical protein